jgi:hypothetical protein
MLKSNLSDIVEIENKVYSLKRKAYISTKSIDKQLGLEIKNTYGLDSKKLKLGDQKKLNVRYTSLPLMILPLGECACN